MNILLADADKNYGLLLKRELEEENYTVDLVLDGVSAVLSFMNKSYGLVLLDVRMPRLSGIDALRIIKGFDPQVKAMTISAHAQKQELEEAIKHGALKCLSKQISIEELKEEIRCYFPPVR